MDISSELIIIRQLRSPEEIHRGQEFISLLYGERYQSPIMSTPEIFFASIRSGEIIGTLGLDITPERELLRLEMMYAFNPKAAPWPYHYGEAVQFSRFGSRVRNVHVAALLYYGTVFGLSCAKKCGLYETKPPIPAYMQGLGVDFRQVTDARLNSSEIPVDHPYYFTQPLPQLFMSNLRQKKGGFVCTNTGCNR